MSKTNNNMMNASNGILSQSAWWVLNKSLTIYLGFDASLLLSDLTAKQDYFHHRGMLDDQGYFYCLRKDIEADTSISEQRQIRALSRLGEEGLVNFYKKKTTPPRIFYRVNHLKINELIIKLHNQ